MSHIIETNKLTKYYGKARGIIEVDLTVEEGEIFGFIGPNGAGKSTTIRTLLGLIHKTSGDAKIFGFDCATQSKKILEDVGYLPSEVFYYENMKAIDLLKYSASFYAKDCGNRIHSLAEALDLDLTRKIEDMSTGNKKKVGIIQGLLHSPKLIIIDEPTSGLDPLMQRRFFDLIKEENAKGATVLFSSHILSEVQRICDRVAIIKEGRIIQTQRISDLQKNNYKKITYEVAQGVAPVLPSVNGITNFVQHEQKASFFYNGSIALLLEDLLRQDLVNIDITDPSLEEIFMHYYADSSGEGGF